MRRLWRASIWHPGSIPSLERKYAIPLKRVVFPVYDVAVILLGWLGLSTGFKAVRVAFPEPGPSIMFAILLAAGVVCLFGASFPRLWVAEILGKFVILVILMVVLIALLVASATLTGYTGLTTVPVMIVMILFPLLRLWILGIEMSERHPPRGEAAWNGF